MTKFRWKQLTAVLLLLTMALLALDIRFGTFSGPSRSLPVLMYHHFDQTSSSGTVVSEARFREQMAALRSAGFEAVTVRQMLDYVENRGALPKKPVLITMDDGYTSNLDIAAPILEEYGLRATVFVIGINEGETTYVHDGSPLTMARFSYEAAAPWVEKGVIDVQSHTFDLHQLAEYGFSGRDGVLALEGESGDAYRKALLADCQSFAQRREGRVSTELLALAYPFGYYSREADDLLRNNFPITFTIEEHTNCLRPGDTDSLRRLGRFNVFDWTSGEDLVQKLELYS